MGKKKKKGSYDERMVREMAEFSAAAAKMSLTPAAPAPKFHNPKEEPPSPSCSTPEKTKHYFTGRTNDPDEFAKFVSGEYHFEDLSQYVSDDYHRAIAMVIIDFFHCVGTMVLEARRKGVKIKPYQDLNPRTVAQMLDLALLSPNLIGGYNGVQTSLLSKALYGEESDTYHGFFRKVFACFMDEIETVEIPPSTDEPAPAATPEVIGTVTTTDGTTSTLLSTDPDAPKDVGPVMATKPLYKIGDIVRILPNLPSGTRVAEVIEYFRNENKMENPVKYKVIIYHTSAELIGSIGSGIFSEVELEKVSKDDLPAARAIIKNNKKAQVERS